MIYKLLKELSMLDIDTICSNPNFNSLTKGSGGKGQEEPVILAPAESDDHFKAKHVHPNHLQLISLQFKTVISQMMRCLSLLHPQLTAKSAVPWCFRGFKRADYGLVLQLT